jgi:UDP-glucose 4-epimerase
MKILVTGGAGFIGSHFVDRFVAEGHQVWALDNLRTGIKSNVNPAAEFIFLDLKDRAVDAKVAEIRPDAICHLAAQSDARASCTDPINDAIENIMVSLRLIEAGMRIGMRFFCFASAGGAIYGEADGPQDETHPECPLSPLGVAKLAVDKYLRTYEALHGLQSASLRFSNVYGPRQAARGDSGVVAAFAKLLRDRKPIRVNGDGLQTRDFIFVSDLAEAASMVLKQGATGVFNLGTGLETSIIDLAKILCSIAGVNPSCIEFGPAFHAEQRRSVIDPTKAAKALVWNPRTSLANGLKTTYEWFATNRQDG